MEREVDAYLRRKFESAIKEVEVVRMEDLELKNHLSGLQRTLLKVGRSVLFASAFWPAHKSQEIPLHTFVSIPSGE